MVAPVENIRHRAGRASLAVQLVSGESAVTSSYATNPLKLLTPRSRGQSVWAYTSSFGGGLVAGDQTRLDLRIGAGACCFLGTQASTKIYRNPAALPSGHETQATLESGSLLVFAPDPVQAFANATYTQRQEFRLASDASLVLLDWFTSGRAARGERWEFNRCQSRNEVWREKGAGRVDQHGESSPLTPTLSPLRGEGVGVVTDARLDSETRRHASTSRSAEHRSALERGVHAASIHESTTVTSTANNVRILQTACRAPSPLNGERAGVRGEHSQNVSPSEIILLDSLLLTPGDGSLMALHRMGRFNCLATLFLIGPAVCDFAAQLLEQISKEPVTRHAPLVASASPVAGGAVLRIAGEQVETVGRELHHHLACLRDLLGDDPWSRKW